MCLIRAADAIGAIARRRVQNLDPGTYLSDK
jgi:hypothetical protein